MSVSVILVGPHVNNRRCTIASIDSIKSIEESKIAFKVQGYWLGCIVIAIEVGGISRNGCIIACIYTGRTCTKVIISTT